MKSSLPLPRALPLALASGLLLPACGAHSSLTEPGECVPWTVHDGAAGQTYSLHPPVVLDDGSVVLSMREGTTKTDGGAGVDWARSWVRKIEPDGAIAWEVADSAAGVVFINSARDAANAIYVSGEADVGASSVLGAPVTCAGLGPCSFIAKLTAKGEPAWVKTFTASAASDRSYLRDLAVSDDGAITVGGEIVGTLDLGCGPMTETAEGGFRNVFLARLSPSGACQWSRLLVFPDEAIERMAVNGAGEVALALNLGGPPGSSVDLGGGPLSFGSDAAHSSFAVAKYAPDGALVFAKAASCNVTVRWPSAAMTAAGEVILSASCRGTIDLGGGPRGSSEISRAFITKFGATGEELWTRDVATSELGAAPPAITVRPGAGIVLAANVSPGTMFFGEPASDHAIFTATLDAGGSPSDLQKLPVSLDPTTGFVDPLWISAGPRSVAINGIFNGTLGFGQDPIASEGTQDTFVTSICR